MQIGDLSIGVTRKAVRYVHLSVHPPEGRVTLVAPTGTRLDVARSYAVSHLGWIRAQQAKMLDQAREAPRRYVNRETHLVWGRRYLLTVREVEARPTVELSHRRLVINVRSGSSTAKRAQVVHTWHKSLLHEAIPPLIRKWERRLGVQVARYHLQRMKTKWGSCNHRAGNIRVNTELVKKPKDLLEYVVVHEMAHLLAPTHSAKFTGLLDQHYPSWREARAELNALPLGVAWGARPGLERLQVGIGDSDGADERFLG